MADHQDYTTIKATVREPALQGSKTADNVATDKPDLTTRWAKSFDAASLRQEMAQKQAADDEDDDESMDRLSISCFGKITTQKLGECTQDVYDELTSLTWLHNSDLLRDFKSNVPLDPFDSLPNGVALNSGRVGREHDPYSVAITAQYSGHAITSSLSSCNSSIGRRSASGKPPYSFACLIFMAIEESPTKNLPVKDIYKWIEDNFEYFRSAPTGWKNSVRHNLSLNKSFKRIDKQKGMAPGKGSLWMVDPINRFSLLQALKKTHHQSFEHYITDKTAGNTRAVSRGSDSSLSDVDSEPHSKRLCVDIAPDEAQAVEIMCSFYNPRAIHEGPVSISGAKSSSDCSTPPLVVPVATFAPTPATPATEQRIQGSGQLMHHEMTAFQPSSHGSRRRNLFSTLATVATLTKDIEENLSRNNSERSSPVQTRRARAAKAAIEEIDTARLLHAAVAKRLAEETGKKSSVDGDFDFENNSGGIHRQQKEDDEEDDELSKSHSNGLGDSGYGGQETKVSDNHSQLQVEEQGMADIILEADKLLAMRDRKTQLSQSEKTIGKNDVNQSGFSSELISGFAIHAS
ncbi:forkhead box protein N3-like isoform X2 [Corticium candelabrum]|uniref:forkhead box protein N3-like isoform X2 n=1 Tax=Corticium candelabrum TaxID=121492 RepID=UPI002E272103|nr:forkhead box protein N3-like isoform X2 [Corticium candelabrum]